MNTLVLVGVGTLGIFLVSRMRSGAGGGIFDLCSLIPELCPGGGTPPPAPAVALVNARLERGYDGGPGEFRAHWDVSSQSGGQGTYSVRVDIVPSHTGCSVGFHDSNVIASTQAPMPIDGVGIYSQDALLYFQGDYHLVDAHLYVLDGNGRIVSGAEVWQCYLVA